MEFSIVLLLLFWGEFVSLFVCLLFCLFGVVVVAVFILHTLALLREFALATALSFQVLCWS